MKRVVETSYVWTQQQTQLRAPRNLSGTDTLPHSTFRVHTYTFGVSIQSDNGLILYIDLGMYRLVK